MLKGSSWESIEIVTQSAGVVEYTECITAERQYSLNECPRYDPKQSDGEAPVMLELERMQSIPLLPLLLGPLWPGVVAPDKILSMGQIELNCVLIKNWIVWNRTVLTFSCVQKKKKLYFG